MTKPDDLTRVKHMLEAANKAIDFTAQHKMESLDNNELLALGLVRLLEIIGEASGRINTEFKARYPLVPWVKIKNMRNRLIHGYFDFDSVLVWRTIKDDLPGLVKEFEIIIKQES